MTGNLARNGDNDSPAAWVPPALEEQARHAQKLAGIGRFANVFAHDFNNLLTVIRAYAELALRDQTVNGQLREQIGAICSAADSAAWLSRQLLAQSRRDSGRPSVVDVNLMIREAHALLGRVLPSALRAELHLQENLPCVLVDPGPLGQALFGAISHVLLSLPAGGRLIIATSTAAPHAPHATHRAGGSDLRAGAAGETAADTPVTIRVAGETALRAPAPGGGITAHLGVAEDEHHVLDDLGHSLATAGDIVREMRGTMRLTDNARAGCMLEITLPGVCNQTVNSGPRLSDASMLRGTVVVLVERDDAVRRSVISVLHALQCTVVAAGSGREALRAAALHPSAAQVLITVPSPGDMGLDALMKAVKRLAPRVATVVMTGRDAPSAPGAEALLVKPFTPDELARAIAAALQAGTERASTTLLHSEGTPQ